ncbi:MAG: hypothetical protein QXL01_00315 [Thermoplasmatales archaeon]
MNAGSFTYQTMTSGASSSQDTNRTPKFKKGDVVRYIQCLFQNPSKQDKHVGTLFIIREAICMVEPLYSLVPIEKQVMSQETMWYAEDELALVLAVEDLVNIANSNRL